MVKHLKNKKIRNNETKNETDKIRKWEEKTKQKYIKYEAKNYINGFQQVETIRSFGDSIYNGNINTELTINLDQKQKKVRIKIQILIKV